MWTGIRCTIAFLMRISEWGFMGKRALRSHYVSFFDSNRREFKVACVADLARIFEVKTHDFGKGTCRSFFAIADKRDNMCIARDVGKLWLMSEQNLEHHVFSWSNDSADPTREQVSAVLKAAAIEDGIPAADLSTHSLRITGLSRLLAAGMTYEVART